jgi:DNA polymerase/3'-5' exonuclease PolX
MKLEAALPIAERLVGCLAPLCTRIQIAGSIRRRKPEVGDIEIVAQPQLQPVGDMFGQPAGYHSLLNDRKLLESLGSVIKGGEKYAQIELPEGINLDLFMVTPPAHWGVILTLRTGPDTFSKRCVTIRQKGGLLPSCYKVDRGAVWSGDRVVDLPEEIDFLNLLGLGWVEPEKRK